MNHADEPNKEQGRGEEMVQPDSQEDQVDEVTTAEDQQLNESHAESEVSPAAPGDELQAQIAEKEDQLLRAAAELENFRKRTRKEKEEIHKYAASGLLTDLLAVVDDLERAVQAAEENENSSGLLDGVKMVLKQFNEVLGKHECRKIDALGKPFDPNLHEAIQMQPSDQFAANHVSLEARTGYQLHDRVLRTSQVFVSTGPADPSSS